MKSSHLLMDSPTEFWKPRRYRYDAEVMTSRMQYQTRLNIAETKIKLDESQVTLLTSKTFQVMQQHIYYNRYSLRFVDMRIPELVTVFNAQVKSREWYNMRAYHNETLINEFQRRGIDTTIRLRW